MKKILRTIVATLAAAMLTTNAQAAEDTFDVMLEINNPSLAKVMYYYFPGGDDYEKNVITFDTSGRYLLQFPAESEPWFRTIYVQPKSPAYFKSVEFYDAEGELLRTAEYNRSTRYPFDIPETCEGGTVKIDVGYIDNYIIHTNIVGNPELINLLFGTNKMEVQSGLQDLEFSPADRYIFVDCGRNDSFYYVGYNGCEVAMTTSTEEGKYLVYSFLIENVVDDANLTLITTKPADEVPLGVSISAPQAVTSYIINGQEALGGANNTLLVTPEAEVSITLDPLFTVSRATINGESTTVTDNLLAFTVTEKTSVAIEGEMTPSAIETIAAPTAPCRRGIFDLHGHRIEAAVSALPPGLYIINGRKIIVR